MDKFAVVDIGSNSVRLVVYESLKRAPYVIFNEKILCGLGRGLSETGRMQDDAMEQALKSLKRFHLMLDKMYVTNYRVVATSAVREAENGPAFADRIRTECHLDVSVIPGIEEARLSGLGILCALPRAQGIMGDLGGGSLELSRLSGKGTVEEKVSFAIGPLKYQSLDGETISSPKADIDRAINSLDWKGNHTQENFYAVGGSWRALAKIHIMEQGYALNNVHHYTMSREEALTLTEKLSKMSYAELIRYRVHISARRLKVLSLSAYILNRLIKKLKSKRLIVSGYGLREGLLYEGMAPDVRAQDPLIAACHDIAANTGRFSEHGKRMQKWIDPLFPNDVFEPNRLRLAASILSDVGWRGHPEYRAEKVLYEVLHGRLLGVNHRGAAFIGLTLYICYGGKTGEKDTAKVETLLKDTDILYANQVGLALRLGQRISGGTAKGLKSAALQMDDTNILLNVKEKDAALVNEVVMERLSKLGKEFGLSVDVRLK
ncbi:MAG: Ppx/GppA family phosphatase [Alphaproteobacteria bacterium]|nr:Ppx/GppA family phosphatase [Alphaproteobacteria bacterium]